MATRTQLIAAAPSPPWEMSSGGSALSFMVLLGVLLAAAVGVALIDPLTVGRGWPALIACESLLVLLLTFGPVVVRMFRSRQPDLLEPVVIVSIVYTLCFVARPLFLISPLSVHIDDVVGEVYRSLRVSEPALALALGHAILGIVAFHAGYRTLQEPSGPRLRLLAAPSWSSTRVTHVATAGIVAAVASLLVVFPVIGGLKGVVADFGRLRGPLVGYGYLGLGLDLLLVLVLLLWVDYLRGTRRLILIPLFLFSNIYNLVIGSRAGVFNLWILMFLSHRYLSGKGFTRRQVVAGLALFLVAIFVTISAGEVRNRGFSDLAGRGDVIQDFWQGSSAGLMVARVLLEFNQVDIYANMLELGPEVFPFRYGETYWALIYQPVPRAWWPEKPWTYDVQIGQMLQGVRTAIPPGVVGEFYLNFHLPGVLLGMFLFGAGYRWAYQRLITVPADPRKVLIYVLLATFLPILMQRAFIAACTTLGTYMVATWLAARYIAHPSGAAAK